MSDPLDVKFFALSDPTRRAILHRLKEGEASVVDLAEPFHMSARAIAKHIAVLESAGLVSRRKESQRTLTGLQANALADIDQWLDSYRVLWSKRFQQLGHRLSPAGKPTAKAKAK